MRQIFKTVGFRIISLLFIQIMVFNNIPLFGFSIPYVYVLIVLLLPFEFNKIFLLIFAFLTGFIIDMSIDTFGVHAGATVLMAYLRPYVLKALMPRGGYLVNTLPIMDSYGFIWYFKYSFLLVSIHHIFLYLFYSFSLEDFFFLLFQIFVNSIVTLLLIILSQYFIYKK